MHTRANGEETCRLLSSWQKDRLTMSVTHEQSDPEPVADIDLAIDKVLMFRLERMDEGVIWIRLYREGGEDKVIWLNSSSAISAIVEGDKAEAALAQSDAGPVEQDANVEEAVACKAHERELKLWADECADKIGGLNGFCEETPPIIIRFLRDAFLAGIRTAIITQSRPDASAGLIAALNAVFRWARQRCPCENDMPAICPLCDADVTKDACKAVPGTFPPRLLKQMQDALRAADRSGK